MARDRVDVAVDYILDRLKDYGPYIEKETNGRTAVLIRFEYLPNGLTHALRVCSYHGEFLGAGSKWQVYPYGVPTEKRQWSRYFANPDKFIRAFKAYYDKTMGLKNDDQSEDMWSDVKKETTTKSNKNIKVWH